MRYYKYNYEYYYTGFEDSDTPLESSTIVPQTADYIIWNPETQLWELEPVIVKTFQETQEEYDTDAINYYDDYMKTVYESIADFEPQTFQTQEAEWREYKKDINAVTPYVDILCLKRGLTKEDLMNKIEQKVLYFASVQGDLHHDQDLIKNCTTIEELNALVLPWL